MDNLLNRWLFVQLWIICAKSRLSCMIEYMCKHGVLLDFMKIKDFLSSRIRQKAMKLK